jgi:hypothetical protein
MLEFVVYFAILFPTLRWWKQADPFRATRLSLWTIAGCVLLAYVIMPVVPFPQPWGLLVAGLISTSVQLASPFVPEELRRLPKAS